MGIASQNDLYSVGRKLTIPEVATLFEVEETTVKRHYARYGGVMLGRKPLFFEKLVSETVERHYATQAHNQGTLDRAMVRTGQAPREPNSQALRLQTCRNGLGSRDETPGERTRDAERIAEDNRHGLL